MPLNLNVFDLVFISVICLANGDLRNRFEVKFYNCSADGYYVTQADCYLRSLSRTIRTLNANIVINKTITDVKVGYIVLRKPLLAPGAYLKIIDASAVLCGPNVKKTDIGYQFTWGMIKMATHFPHDCPIPAGTYKFNNFNYNRVFGELIPALFPDGRYRIDNTFTSRKGALLSFRTEALFTADGIVND